MQMVSGKQTRQEMHAAAQLYVTILNLRLYEVPKWQFGAAPLVHQMLVRAAMEY